MKRPPAIVGLNTLDKAIAWFAPRVAARRLHARQVLALSGGYNAARRDRASMTNAVMYGGSPESDVIADLPTLRAESRDAERNQPAATSVINTTTSHAVGTGLSCNPRINAKVLKLSDEAAQEWQETTRARFMQWFGSKDCDLGRRQNGYEIQDLVLRSVLSSGDTLVVLPLVRRIGAAYPQIALQVIEADRLSNPNRQSDTETLTDGVECSEDTGEAIAFHVCNRHPGDFTLGSAKPLRWDRILARGAQTGRLGALHLFKVLRPGLRRGVPILAPVMEPLRQVSRFAKAELDAAVNSALFALFAEMDAKAFDETFTDDSKKSIVDKASKWSGEIESGQIMNLLPGETVSSPTPGRPNPEFDPFFMACMRQIGMATGIPVEVLTMHYQSSYSAARGALLMAWRMFMGWRDFLSTNLCQPVYEVWLSDEVANDRIIAPGFFADPVVRAAWCCAQWVGDGPGSLDPTKEIAAATDRVALGVSTLQAESQAYDGVDWETKHRQTVREAEARRAAGLSVPGEIPTKSAAIVDSTTAEPANVPAPVRKPVPPAPPPRQPKRSA
jgi:lambda family phage portal protein